MERYFGNTVTTVTTAGIVALLCFIGESVRNRASIRHWGCRTALLLVFGLVICCFAAARDGLDRSIQYAIDGSGTPGRFPLVSVPNIVGCIGALLILASAVAAPIARTQREREVWFYIMSAGAVLKIVTLEIARLLF